MEVTKISKDTTLARIIHAVEEAHTKKSSFQRIGEAFRKIYSCYVCSCPRSDGDSCSLKK